MTQPNLPAIVEKVEGEEGFYNEHGLKQALDSVDQAVINYAQPKVHECQYLSITGQWVKGKLIFDHLGGAQKVGVAPGWRELERQTGRARRSLKRWFDLYMEHPDEEGFKEWAQDIATIRMVKWGEAIEALSEGEKEEPKSPKDTGLDWLKCLVKHYSGTDPVWIQGCKGCLTMGLCRDIVGLVEKEVIRMQKKEGE